MPVAQLYTDDPTIQTNAILLQQQQAIAQMLLEQSQQPYSADIPQGLRVVPRMGIANGLVKLGQALMAGRMQAQNAQAQGQLNADYFHSVLGMMNGGAQPMPAADPGTGGAAPQPAQPPVNPRLQAVGQALQSGAAQGSIGPTNDNAARMDATMSAMADGSLGRPQRLDPIAPVVSQDQRVARPDQVTPMISQEQRATRPTSGSPMNPTGINPQLAAMSFVSNPADYLKTVIGQLAPTDFQKVAMAAGYRPGTPEYNQLLQANLAKQNFIAPTPIRPGGGIKDARTGVITTMPTQAPTGFQNVQQPDGSWATIPTQGGTGAVTASTAAGEAGKAPFNMIDTFANGVPGKNYAGNVLPLPQIPGVNFGGPSAAQPPAPAPSGDGPAPTFDLHGSLQKQSAILADIARRGPNQMVRDAALQRLQDMHALATTGSAGGSSSPKPMAQGAANGGGANGVQTGPAIGQAQGATNAQDLLTKKWGDVNAQASQAQAVINNLQQIKSLAASARTGAFTDRQQMADAVLTMLGSNDAAQRQTANQLLGKNAAQITTRLGQGSLNTDAARELIYNAFPNAHMMSDAITEASDNLVAQQRMAQSKAQVLEPFAIRSDPQGYQQAETAFNLAADPRIFQARAIADPAARKAYMGKILAQDPTLASKAQALEQLGVQ